MSNRNHVLTQVSQHLWLCSSPPALLLHTLYHYETIQGAILTIVPH